MDGPKQSQRKINIRHCLYAESKKIDTNELTYKTETDLENKHIWLPKGKLEGGAINWEFGIDIYTLLYLK